MSLRELQGCCSRPWNSLCSGERWAGNQVMLGMANQMDTFGLCSQSNEELKLGGWVRERALDMCR